MECKAFGKTEETGVTEMRYQYRIKAIGQSVYCKGFDEVKEQVLLFINKNNCGVVYEKIDGIDVLVWRFDVHEGMVRAL